MAWERAPGTCRRRESEGPTQREEGEMEVVGPKTRTWEETLAAARAPCSELPSRASSDTPCPHPGPPPSHPPSQRPHLWGAPGHSVPGMGLPAGLAAPPPPRSPPSFLSHRSDQILTHSWVLPPCSVIDVSPVNLLPGSYHSGVCFSKDSEDSLVS